ncbi:hypothetical protein LIER_17909 [Lithospermum erythrorhizon]|uniref:Uncharacterized protein n=1 Tax=Lithospermum erythrorhizon TaxID=34254 RepID=A0AAV3QC94_LITER
MLAYRVEADACDENVNIGEAATLECHCRLCEGIISIFEKDYMRRSNAEDLQRLLHLGSKRGFPGMIGSIDFMHCQLKNCLKARQGQFTSRHKGTT